MDLWTLIQVVSYCLSNEKLIAIGEKISFNTLILQNYCAESKSETLHKIDVFFSFLFFFCYKYGQPVHEYDTINKCVLLNIFYYNNHKKFTLFKLPSGFVITSTKEVLNS